MAPPAKRDLVVVAGATGHVGSCTVTELLAAGYAVRAVVRSSGATPAAAAGRLQAAGAEVWWGDVTKPATLRGCCDGARAAVSCLGVR